MKTNTIGLLGLGKETTNFYLNQLDCTNTDQNHVGYSISLLSTDFSEINNLLPKVSNQLDHILMSYIDELIDLNVEAIIIPNITLHETIDRLEIEIPIIHPVYSTASELAKNNIKRIVLFGSKYTMESIYVKSIFEEHQIAIILPSADDVKFIDEFRKQVYYKTTTTDVLAKFNLMVKKYAQTDIVVLACTELSLTSINRNKKVYDMARIQINETVRLVQKS